LLTFDEALLSQTSPDRFQEQPRAPSRPVQPIDVDSRNNSRNATTLKPHADLSTSRPPAHSREGSLNKPVSAGLIASATPLDIRQNGALSPRFATGRTRAGSFGGDNFADLKSMPYGHHRQTSIVHGVQHPRSGSVAGPISSPLSPQMIAAAGGAASDVTNMARIEIDATSPLSIMSANSSFSTATTMVSEKSTAVESGSTTTQKRVERMHSGRTRRENSHHHSHSRHYHKEDTKTVGEYALHVLFTSVSSLFILCLNSSLTYT
jgi:hypothetical protein